jgi:hypothetical protein
MYRARCTLDRLRIEVVLPPGVGIIMAPGLEVADSFRRQGDAFRLAYAGRLSRSSRHTMAPTRRAGPRTLARRTRWIA